MVECRYQIIRQENRRKSCRSGKGSRKSRKSCRSRKASKASRKSRRSRGAPCRAPRKCSHRVSRKRRKSRKSRKCSHRASRKRPRFQLHF